MSSVSIKDIARAAGVSHSTVSRALSGSPLVRAETRARIRHLASEMGYSPDAQARSLVLRQTRTVGVVFTSIADPFNAEVMQGIDHTAQERGYSVILSSSDYEPEREIAAVEMLRSKRVDGVIVASSRIGVLYLDHLQRIGVPLVLINNHREGNEGKIYSITVDNAHGGRLATRHLIELGHRRIAYITARANYSSNAGRLEGYRQALAEAGIAYDPVLVMPGNGRFDGGERGLAVLMGLESPPTAVFCYNDMTAIGLMHAAHVARMSIPGDLAVVGFDDIPFASYVCPTLTTVAQPKFEMGKLAMEMILDLLDVQKTNGTVPNIVMQGQLIVRESTGVNS